MAGFVFAEQLRRGSLDAWAVLGIRPSPDITPSQITELCSRFVRPHVTPRHPTGRAPTEGATVPTLEQVDAALDMLDTTDAIRQCAQGHAEQTWNPYALPGTSEAYSPWDEVGGTSFCPAPISCRIHTRAKPAGLEHG